jgi:hypothetical protein
MAVNKNFMRPKPVKGQKKHEKSYFSMIPGPNKFTIFILWYDVKSFK